MYSRSDHLRWFTAGSRGRLCFEQDRSLRLQCHQIERREIEPELAAGQLDFAIDVPQLGRATLNGVKLLTEHYVCLLRRSHPLARRKLTLQRYLAMPQVVVSARRHGRSWVDIALGRIGERAHTVLRLPQYQPAMHVIPGSDLALTAPRSLAAWYDVEARELPFEVPSLDSVLYWHRNTDRDPANLWMREQIVAATRTKGEPAPGG